jgi:mono/diheme cytochrome c family protein
VSVSGRLLVPLAAGLAAAAAAFVVVAATTDGGDGATAPAPGGRLEGRAVFARMGCGGCHHLTAANANGPIGPDLDAMLPVHTRKSLTAQILAPRPESGMPTDFGERMSDAELEALIAFLLSAREAR